MVSENHVMTEYIRLPPKGGKTQQIIERAKDCNGYIVVRDHDAARMVAQRAREEKIDIHFPLSYEEFIRGQFHGRNCSPLHIDNADELVQYIAYRNGGTVATVTETVFSETPEGQ